MQRRSYELWSALGAMLVITLLYLWVISRLTTVPPASDLFGHSLGIIGFLLMLMTETLYSLRKRSRAARWGRMSSWLRFHIFTGLVGPYLVVLHSSWKFNGLAGIVTALMLIVVLSGIVGRYIYTAVPRTADGVVIGTAELEQQIRVAEADLQRWLAGRPADERRRIQRLATLSDSSAGGPRLVLGRAFLEWGQRLVWRRERQRMSSLDRSQARELERLIRQRQSLRRQVTSLALARRMLATWHSIHIPIGVALFTVAFVHIGAAVYYATLLR